MKFKRFLAIAVATMIVALSGCNSAVQVEKQTENETTTLLEMEATTKNNELIADTNNIQISISDGETTTNNSQKTNQNVDTDRPNTNEDINDKNINRIKSGDIKDGDSVERGDYIYTFNKKYNGWMVEVVDRTKTSYEEIEGNLYGIPVVSMQGCFFNCPNMLVAPKIPSSIKYLDSCFTSCASLLSAPTIPQNVTSMDYCFVFCDNLSGAVAISSSNLSSAENAFSDNGNITINVPSDSQTKDVVLDAISGLNISLVEN